MVLMKSLYAEENVPLLLTNSSFSFLKALEIHVKSYSDLVADHLVYDLIVCDLIACDIIWCDLIACNIIACDLIACVCSYSSQSRWTTASLLVLNYSLANI